MSDDWPIFGRDVPGAAWRPASDGAAKTRLGRFIRATGERDLETLQRHAEGDPAWFWQAAADDLQLYWQRRPTQTLDLSRGPEWSRWWTGGAFNYAAAAVDPRAQRDPDGAALTWEGEDGTITRLTNAELKAQVDRAAAMFARLGVAAGRPRRHLPAAPARDGHIRVGTWKAEGDLHPDLLRLRGSGGCEQAQRRGCHLACHSRRHASPRQRRGHEAHCRRRSRTGADGQKRPRRRSHQPARAAGRLGGGSGSLVVGGDGRPDARAHVRGTGDRSRDPVHDHLHVGHDREAQGRGPRPRRLPGSKARRTLRIASTWARATGSSGSPTSAG